MNLSGALYLCVAVVKMCYPNGLDCSEEFSSMDLPMPQLSHLLPGADSAVVTQESLLSSSAGRQVLYEAILLLRSTAAPALTTALQCWKRIRVS